MPKSRVLVIDDEAAIRDSLRMTLEYAGYEFIGAATGQEGLARARRADTGSLTRHRATSPRPCPSAQYLAAR